MGRIAAAALVLLSGACGGEKPIARAGDAATATPPVVPAEALTANAPPPVHARTLVADWRAEEEPLLRSHAPAVERTGWARLVITAEDGSRHVFADEVVGDDLRWMHLFAGHVAPIDAYVVEKRYIPEGGEWLLVEAGTGRTTRIDAPPSPSPDGRRFVTTSVDLVAGHRPNRVRIYRREASGPVLEWELEPHEWGGRFSAWRDDGTLRLERIDLDWSTYGELTSPLETTREKGAWRLQPSPEHARNVLLSFLSALASKHYIEAARYYGGTYDHLRGWNPGIDPQDLPSLWRAACEFNGLQCLGRAEVVRTEPVSPTEARFHLRLFHASGERFVQGPCCGETATTMPPRSEFAFTVRRVGSEYRVMDPPPYVP